MVPLDLCNDPLPERECLGVWIVDAEDRHTHTNPIVEHVFQLRPHSLPIIAFKVEGINILVFLGRIFSILDASVWSFLEPSLMILDVGMIRCSLEGNIHRDR